jgi:Fe-S cluster assembly protein SufD
MKKNIKAQKNSYNNELNSLPYPSFLAYNFEGLNFEYKENTKSQDNEKFKNQLLKKHNENNTIILLDGQVILNNVKSVKLAHTAPKQTVKTKFDFLNKEHLNSSLKLEFLNNEELKINIIIAATNDLYHFSEYVIKSDAQVKVTEQFELKNSAKLNYKASLDLRQNASLNLVSVETLKNKEANVVAVIAKLAENAELKITTFNLNQSDTINTANVYLNGQYAKAQVNTVNFANKNTKLANLANIKHFSKNTTSNINNFAVANDNAEVIIDGVNVIEQGFSKSEARQETKIINLTDTAKVVANPQLEINEYDVAAGHYATVGRVDEEQLYYLMSRGLTKHESIELIIMSNVDNALAELDSKKLLRNVLKRIKSKLA